MDVHGDVEEFEGFEGDVVNYHDLCRAAIREFPEIAGELGIAIPGSSD